MMLDSERTWRSRNGHASLQIHTDVHLVSQWGLPRLLALRLFKTICCASKCSKVALPCFLARCHPMRGCQTPQIGIRLPLFFVPSIKSGWWFQPLWKIWKSIGMIIPNIWENTKCSKPPTRNALRIADMEGTNDVKKMPRKLHGSRPWSCSTKVPMIAAAFPFPEVLATSKSPIHPAGSCYWRWLMLMLILLSFGHQTWQ